MFAVVGLGNPGRRYAGTRHNVGFAIVELLLERHDGHLLAGNGDYTVAEVAIEGSQVWLIKPSTFVNDSGRALIQFLSRRSLELDRLLVLCDDINLPLGKIRLRRRGADGGHRGLASIINALGSMEFPRMRIGVGDPRNGDLVPFVLGKFSLEEEKIITAVFERAALAVKSFVSEGIEQAMNKFNG